MDNSWLVSEDNLGSINKMSDRYYVNEGGSFTVHLDPKNVPPILNRYYKILSLQALLSLVEKNGYEIHYKFASKEEKKFLESIKDIANDPKLLKEKSLELGKQLPSAEEIKNVPI